MTTENTPLQLGHSLLKQFKLAPNYVNLNHGSFGTTPISVLKKQRAYVDEMEARPDVWYRKTYREKVLQARKQLAGCFNAEEEGLVFVENASTGVNSVLRALKWEEGKDTILYLSTAYPMVVHTLEYLKNTQNINLHKVDITFPTSSNAIVQLVEQAILQVKSEYPKRKLRIAVFSHITSVPAIILPVEKLISLFHQHNILTLVDGAHAPGQIPLDLKAIGADFYAGNLHKWFYSPKGSGFLFISSPFRSLIVPTVISSEFKGIESSTESKFEYTGTRDYTAFCAVPEAIAFRDRIGATQIYDYLHKLAFDGGKLLATMWGTEVLHTEEEMVGSMVNVRLPTTNSSLSSSLSKVLLEKYNTFLVVFPLQGNLWTRVSAAPYLEIGDFKWLGEIVLKELKE